MELWLAAERAYDMARAFNAREGIGPEQDHLPKRLLEQLPTGPMADRIYIARKSSTPPWSSCTR
jgi:aldehyde:ferredoxin oxidoreductase